MVARYEGAHWLGRTVDTWLNAPHTERLSALDLPVAVLVGERGGPRGIHMGQEIVRPCPRATIEILLGVGHLSPIEAPAEVVARIRSVVAT